MWALGVTVAHAQIRQPGAHPKYSTEVEPHLVWQWGGDGWWDDEGIGVGVRITIPLVHNGPIDSINNNMGIGFGLDWAHFEDACYVGLDNRGRPIFPSWACTGGSMNDFWLPVVWQWSFYFSKLVSAFFEPGLAIQHTRWDGEVCAGGFCPYDETDTDIDIVIWLGVRFHLSDDFALVLRLGHPSFNFGPAFLL
jgi:hypothetical protein